MISGLLLCKIINQIGVQFLVTDQHDGPHGIAHCAPALTVFRWDRCLIELSSSSASDRVSVLAYSNSGMTSHQLKRLEEECFPQAQIWCWLHPNFTEAPRGCDAFIVSPRVQMISEISSLTSGGVTAFTTRKNFQICNSAGVFSSDRISRASDMALNVTFCDFELYTGKYRESTSKSPSFEGIETGVLRILGEYLNVTWRDSHKLQSGKPLFHLATKNNAARWNETTFGYLQHKKAVLAFGDLSLTHPRQLYADLALQIIGDGNTFLQMLPAPTTDFRTMLSQCEPSVMILFLISSLTLSVVCRLGNRGRVSAQNLPTTFVYMFSLLFHPSSAPLRFNRVSKILDVGWRFVVFFFACNFSGSLLTSLTSMGDDGRIESTDQVIKLVASKPQLEIFLMKACVFMEHLFHLNPSLEANAHTFDSTDEGFDRFVAQKATLFKSERLILQELILKKRLQNRAHIMRDNLFYTFMAFAMPKGCFLFKKINQVCLIHPFLEFNSLAM